MRRAAAAALLACAAPALAHPPAELARCAAIDPDAQRLACYDALARAAADRPAPPEPVAAPAPVAPPAPAPSPEAAFGLAEQREEKQEIESIQSRLAGPFTGWEHDTVFRLENGQVWKSAVSGGAYYPHVPDNPAVRISRGWLGSYWMEVLGTEHTIRVKVRRLR